MGGRGGWSVGDAVPGADGCDGPELQLVALAFPRGQALGRFFAAGREQARPE